MITTGATQMNPIFVTNFIVHESQPYIFGVNDKGQTVGVRALHMPFVIYIEPSVNAQDQDKTRTWMNTRLRPFLEKNSRLSRYFRPSMQLVSRKKLCGYSSQTQWFAKIMYDTANDAKNDTFDLKTKFRACQVYHDRLDPNLVFSAHTGIRCFTWITCNHANEVRHEHKKTRCDVELQTDVKNLSTTYTDEDDVRNVPPLLKIASFDIETDGLSWDKGDEIRMISISSSDNRDILLTRHALSGKPDYDVVVCENEIDLLKTFVDTIADLRPVFLTGWNIFRFDVQFVFERAKTLGIFSYIEKLSWLACKNLKPVVKEMSSNAFGQNKVYHDDLEGLITIDGYMLARKGMKMPSYSLKAFGEWIGDAKGDVTYDDMVRAFTTKDPVLMRNVADYCVQDSKLVPKILVRMEEPAKVMAMTRLASVPPLYVIKRGQSILTFGLIVAEAFQRQLVINPPPRVEGQAQGYQGATVIDPVRGYHKDPVAVLDFESLYPSIMRAYNICISTFIGTFPSSQTMPSHFQFPEYSVIEIDGGLRVVFKREGQEGVFPSILRVLLERRKSVKSTMKAFEKNSIAYNQANAKQLSLKVAANSLYGYLGAPTSQIYEKALAASVTSMGRTSLFKVRTIIETLCQESKIPQQVHVVYGDSVSGDTPVLLRRNGRISIECIQDLIGDWALYHDTKEAYVPSTDVEVWDEHNFTKIKRVIRHKTNKAILRVLTSSGLVDCTEDHSLLTKDGTKVSPNATNIGDELLHFDEQRLIDTLSSQKTSLSLSHQDAFEAGIYEHDIDHKLLCASLEIIREYWTAADVQPDKIYTKQRAMGLYILGLRLGIRHCFRSVDETSNKFFMHVSSSTKDDEVQHLWILPNNDDDYVYDIETDSHHFHVGPGRLVVHNTDSVMVKFGGISPEKANDLALFIEEQCTAAFVPPMRLEFENLFSTYLLENKKRYAGKVWSTNEKVVKGLCVKRRDFPKIVQDALSGILDLLLQGGEDAPAKALEFVETILQQLSTNAVHIEKLCITKELNKKGKCDKCTVEKCKHTYQSPPPHLIVSEKMASRNPHNAPKVGDRITFVVMNGRGNISERAEEYQYAKSLGNKVKFDLGYYAEQLVSQCENMMTLCGKKTEFERLSQRYINIARLYCDRQNKLSVYFQPTSSLPSVPSATTTTTSNKRDLPSPKKQQQQATLKKFFCAKK